MSDLIERQAAIDALKGLPTWWADEGGYYGGAQPPMVALLDPEDTVSAIENLPSAQPEIVRCKDCKHHWTHRCMDSMPTEICDLDQTFYDPNIDFCSLAERRTDGV